MCLCITYVARELGCSKTVKDQLAAEIDGTDSKICCMYEYDIYVARLDYRLVYLVLYHRKCEGSFIICRYSVIDMMA